MRSNRTWYLIRSEYMNTSTDQGLGLLNAAFRMGKLMKSIGDGMATVVFA